MEESSRCNEVVGVDGISNIIDTNNKLMEKKYLLNKLLEDSSIQSTLMKVKGDEALTGEDNYFLTILEKNKFNLDNSIQDYIIEKCYGSDRTVDVESLKEAVDVVRRHN